MLNDGLMENEKPQVALGLHVGSLYKAGQAQVSSWATDGGGGYVGNGDTRQGRSRRLPTSKY